MNNKYYMKGILNVFGTMLIETIIHFIIVILIKGFYFNAWGDLFVYYDNTGTYSIERISYRVLSILGLRMILLEFVFRLFIQFSSFNMKTKLTGMIILTCFYMLTIGTLFFGYGFQWKDFFTLYTGWYIQVPIAVIIVGFMKYVFFLRR